MAVLYRALFTWFISLIFLILVVLRLDDRVRWSWFVVFVPMWLYDSILLICLITSLSSSDRWQRGAIKHLSCLGALVIKVTSQILLCLRLDGADIKLYFVLTPVWIGAPFLIANSFLSLFDSDLVQFSSRMFNRSCYCCTLFGYFSPLFTEFLRKHNISYNEMKEFVPSSGNMDLVEVVQSYILKILDEAGPGMKVMLLDSETTPIVSLAFAQSALMRQEVYLFERLQAKPVFEDMRHLKCIVIARPEDSIPMICAELSNPRYGSYYLNFTNLIPKSSVKQIAEADMQEVVRDIKEIYTDFYPIGAHLFTVNIPKPLQPLGSRWVESSLLRSGQALASVLIAFKMSPVIRYQEGSGPANFLAQTVRQIIAREGGLFDADASLNNTPVLLVLDRREDPVTPLLTQWTYQAMVHQLIGIKNNRVSLAGVPGVSKDLQDIVLSSSQDEFYAGNLYSNFGEIGQTIKILMEDFQNKAKSHQQIESISDMKNFIENYPQFKKMSGTVSKHVTLVSELSRIVGQRKLLELSEIEQEVVSGGDHSTMLKQVSELVSRESISLDDATRLVMLFMLRFESHPNSGVRTLINALRKRGGEAEARQVHNLQRFAGSNARRGELFKGEGGATSNITGKLFKGLKGVENVYTQHQPLLKSILEDLIRGRLRSNLFPSLGSQYDGKISTVVAFIIGGITYEEAHAVYLLNSTLKTQILLGGTSLLNSQTFIEQVDHAFPSQQGENAV